jgi:cytochrome c-type biogenesis protein CcmH
MAIWFFMVILCSLAAVLIAFPLIRSYEARLSPGQDMAVYQDQLQEVGRDLESGGINAAEAKSAQAEIQRRLEAASKSQVEAKPLPQGWKYAAIVMAVGIVIVGGVGLYVPLGSPGLPSAGGQQQAVAAAQDSAKQIEQILKKIQDKAAANPNDPEGWRMLGWAMFNVQRYPESIDAFTKAVALAPENTDYQAMLAEANIQATQGTVTPAAQKLIDGVLAKDPKNMRARYYDALGHEQSGDQQGALDRWMALMADSPASAPWRDDLANRITTLGKALGKDVSSIVNAPPALTPEEQTMVEGMVQKLADELKQNPKNLDGWMKLMRSYSVLKQTDKAKAAFADAMQAFAADVVSQEKLKAAADELGFKP